jgi:hypothetical protein
MKSLLHSLLAFGLALLVPVAFAGTTIYVYVDETGVPHFTDAPTHVPAGAVPAIASSR